jgi:hypothetical protein
MGIPHGYVSKQYRPVLVSVRDGKIVGVVIGAITRSRSHLIDSLIAKLGQRPAQSFE